jgi:aspartate kinase
MIIQKFGGTSVGSPQRMKELAKITLHNPQNSRLVVLSAVAGTTNKLVAISALLKEKLVCEAATAIQVLREEYDNFVERLFGTLPYQTRGNEVLDISFDAIYKASNQSYSEAVEKVILAQGELISTRLYHLYLLSIGVEATLINALDFIRTDANGEPDMDATRKLLNPILDALDHKTYIVTQGYICRNINGEIDNLQRGGSDYTATILGAALYAEEVQIWTDIDGMHNNDPRIVANTSPVRKISYREAAELAYFGAKILHPTCIIPTEAEQVPVRLKYTFDPSAPGTYISNESSGKSVTAIAAKDNITYIRITSDRMINAYGFLRKVFEVFEKYETPIDMITTSEVSVSLSIDNDTYINHIISDLHKFGKISFEKNQSIICIVGDKLGQDTSVSATVLSAFTDIPVNMISYGGSINNISVLINSDYKESALLGLHEVLFVQSELKQVATS